MTSLKAVLIIPALRNAYNRL